MKKEMLVGAVFVAALILTAFGTIVVSGFNVFTRTDTWIIRTKDVGGLQSGDDVRVLGARMGTIRDIQFDKQAHEFKIRAEMQRETPIYEGYEILARESTALGGRYLDVFPGSPERSRVDMAHLRAKPGLTGSLTDLLVELDKTATAISEAQGTLGKLIMEDDIYQDLKSTSESLKIIAGRIEAGQGLIGRMINEDEIYVALRNIVNRLNEGNSALGKLMQDESGAMVDDLSQTLANLRSITAKADSGTGTIGKLINDPALYDEATITMTKAGKLMTDVTEGKGILGMLLHDEAARTQFSEILENLNTFTGLINSNEGTLGRLLTDPRVFDNLLSASEHLDNVMAKLDNGQGTIGKLVNDPELYDNLKRLVARAIDSVENARDSAPVSAVMSFLLGPFQ